jgi:hypothetical protein
LNTNTGPSPLRYLYLIFLVAGFVVLAIAARIYYVKKRRTKKYQQQTMVRAAALRRDLEQRRGSDENSNANTSSPEMVQHTLENDYFQPPPPYPQAAYKLPIYEEVEEAKDDLRMSDPMSVGQSSTDHSTTSNTSPRSPVAFPQPAYRGASARHSQYRAFEEPISERPPSRSPPTHSTSFSNTHVDSIEEENQESTLG